MVHWSKSDKDLLMIDYVLQDYVLQLPMLYSYQQRKAKRHKHTAEGAMSEVGYESDTDTPQTRHKTCRTRNMSNKNYKIKKKTLCHCRVRASCRLCLKRKELNGLKNKKYILLIPFVPI